MWDILHCSWRWNSSPWQVKVHIKYFCPRLLFKVQKRTIVKAGLVFKQSPWTKSKPYLPYPEWCFSNWHKLLNLHRNEVFRIHKALLSHKYLLEFKPTKFFFTCKCFWWSWQSARLPWHVPWTESDTWDTWPLPVCRDTCRREDDPPSIARYDPASPGHRLGTQPPATSRI